MSELNSPSRSASSTSFSIYYSNLNRDMCDIRDKLYFCLINLSNSFFTPFSVQFLPIKVATSSQLSRLKNLYRIILCIRNGISFIHSSTPSFRSEATFLCSSRILFSLASVKASAAVSTDPPRLKDRSSYGQSGLLPRTLS